MKRPISLARLTALSVALCAGISETAFAQGNFCSGPTDIQGTGVWNWGADLYGASNFQPGNACEFDDFMLDRFFRWTVPVDGEYVFDTAASTWNTNIAVYEGTDCNAVCLASDTSFGVVSVVTMPGLVAGDTYLIRVGILSDPHTPQAGFSISLNDGACDADPGDAFENNDTWLDPSPVSDGTYTNLFVSNFRRDNYSTCMAPGATLQVDLSFVHTDGNINMFFGVVDPDNIGGGYVETSSSFSQTDDETLSWTNNTGTRQSVLIIVFLHLDSTIHNCTHYDMVVSGSGNCGFTPSTFCDPMDPNSTGLPTLLTASASTAAGSGMHLSATQGPPAQFGFFLVGTAASDPGLPLSQGRFCLAITGGERYGRYSIGGTNLNSIGRFSPAGELVNLSGTSSTGTGFDVPLELPLQVSPGVGMQIYAGQTWHWQLWHREPNGQSNFSNGVTGAF